MRGTIVHRGTHRWALVLDLGVVDGKRKQQWISFRSTPIAASGKPTTMREQRNEAQAKLTELLNDQNKGTYIAPSKLTLISHLRAWLETSVKPMRRPETYRTYRSLIETHVAGSTIAGLPLQQLRGSHLEAFYATLPLAPSSVTVLHAAIGKALRRAVKGRVLSVNPAIGIERRKPEKDASIANAQRHCWTAVEAKRVIDAAKTASPQLAAYVFLALDSGARKGELDGLSWADLDLETGVLTIARQLDSAKLTEAGAVSFGPTKRRRTATLGAETLATLRAHRQAQRELNMRNRTTYTDLGLVFAKEEADLQTPTAALGEPLDTLSENRFQALVKAAGVRRIKFHGVRHTVATLSLAAGVPPHVVADRLGHSVMELMKTYAHALPNMQQDAAARLGALLHG